MGTRATARGARGRQRRLILVAVIASSPAAADAQDWVVGVAGGVATQRDYDIGAPIPDRDDTDAGARIFVGYLIGSMQAVIASYVDLGTQSYAGPAFGGFSDTFEADGFDLSYVAGWTPGNQQRVAVFGTVGVMNWDQDVRFTDSTGVFEFRDEGTSLTLGVGAEFRLGRDAGSPWSVHVAYQSFTDIGDTTNSGQELDRDLVSVGIAYRFVRRQ